MYFNAAHLRETKFQLKSKTAAVRGRDTRSVTRRTEQARLHMSATLNTKIEKKCYF